MINAVAIIYKGHTYALYKPNRHHHVIALIHRMTGDINIRGEQGFLNDKLKFLNRTEAALLAKVNGQVFRGFKFRGGRLYSEDLW